MVTHDMQIAQYAHTIIELKDGRIQQIHENDSRKNKAIEEA